MRYQMVVKKYLKACTTAHHPRWHEACRRQKTIIDPSEVSRGGIKLKPNYIVKTHDARQGRVAER